MLINVNTESTPTSITVTYAKVSVMEERKEMFYLTQHTVFRFIRIISKICPSNIHNMAIFTETRKMYISH